MTIGIVDSFDGLMRERRYDVTVIGNIQRCHNRAPPQRLTCRCGGSSFCNSAASTRCVRSLST